MAQYVEGPYIVEDQPDGTRRVVGYAPNNQPSTVITKRADPYRETEEQRKQQAAQIAAESADRANQNSAISNNNSQAMTQLARERFEFEKNKALAESGTQKQPEELANIRADALQKIALSRDLANRSRDGYFTTGFGSGLAGAFQGTDAYDLAKDTETLKNAGALQRIMEMAATNGGKNPLAPLSSSDFQVLASSLTNLDPGQSDAQYQKNLRIVEDLYSRAYAASGGGHLDDELGVINGSQGTGNSQGAPPSRPDQSNSAQEIFGERPSEATNGGFVPYGAKTKRVPNPQWKGVNAAVKGMIVAGRPRQEIQEFLNSKGISTEAITGLDLAVKYFREQGKRDFGVDVENIDVPLSNLEQFRNDAPQTRLGTTAATALNAGGLGIPQALAGREGLDYLRSQNPKSAFVGDVAGMIGGTAAIGRAGSLAARKLGGSALLGGGKKAAVARQVGTDATYGAAYGAATEGDPLAGALTAAAGSLGGQAIGKGIQKTFQGGGTAAAQYLRDRGIPLTLPQALGGLSKRLEDGATSTPLLGDIITNRRNEGLEEFNRAAFQDAGAPIGASVDNIGEAGMDSLRPQISRAYDNATDGVNIDLDQQYAKDLRPLIKQGSDLSGDYGAGFGRLINNRVKPALDNGQLSGANYQNLIRSMRDSRASVKGQPFADDYIEPVKGIEAATRSLMNRQGGESVISGLGLADEAFRNSKVLGGAIEAAKNTDSVFLPSQLNSASVANARKIGGNGATENRPFRDLAMAAQDVLPSKIADSGTALRAGLGYGGIAGLTGASGYASGGDPLTTAAPIGITGLLAALGTKRGQRYLVKGLMDRGPKVKRAGAMLGGKRARKGISSFLTVSGRGIQDDDE